MGKKNKTISVQSQKSTKLNNHEQNIENLQKTTNLFSEVDKFLHEPNRLQIISQLYALDEVDMIYLKKILNLTWGNLSFHSTKLEEIGYISVKKEFLGKKPFTILKITEIGKQQFENYKRNMQKFLSTT